MIRLILLQMIIVIGSHILIRDWKYSNTEEPIQIHNQKKGTFLSILISFIHFYFICLIFPYQVCLGKFNKDDNNEKKYESVFFTFFVLNYLAQLVFIFLNIFLSVCFVIVFFIFIGEKKSVYTFYFSVLYRFKQARSQDFFQGGTYWWSTWTFEIIIRKLPYQYTRKRFQVLQ